MVVQSLQCGMQTLMVDIHSITLPIILVIVVLKLEVWAVIVVVSRLGIILKYAHQILVL